MRRLGRLVLVFASLFLATVAVLIDSLALFYMATAMVGMIGFCRLQAWLSVRGLRFERITPPAVRVGETVSISMIVWSVKRLKRTLVLLEDGIPSRLNRIDETPSLPVAPAYDQPIQTRYSFRPLRRGRFSWNKVRVHGTDALGIVTMDRVYETEPAELIVYPAPIAVSHALMPAAGWGTTEAESGKFRGTGIEPRGVREYSQGDPLRFVHWASSARSGRLMVKEFEAGAGLNTYFFIQRISGSDIGEGNMSTLEAMCGHVAYLCDRFLFMGSSVSLPSIEADLKGAGIEERKRQIDEALASITGDGGETISDEISRARRLGSLLGGMYILISVQDPELLRVLASLPDVQKTCLIYDPSDYQTKVRLPFDHKSAANEDYLADLRAAGALVTIMPKVEAFS